MSGLTNQDRQDLSALAGEAAWKQFVRMPSSNPNDLTRHAMLAIYPAVEAIVQRAVNEAVERIALDADAIDSVTVDSDIWHDVAEFVRARRT